MPEISVVMPAYQAEGGLMESVESVRRQTFPDWELLVVDDGSTDGTAALCERLAAADSRIRLLRQPRNLGVSAARNRGLEEARGAYIAFLDADDAFVPRTLEVLRELCVRTGSDAAGCAHWNVTPDGGAAVEPLLPAGTYADGDVREKLVRPLLAERLRVPLLNGYVWRLLFSAARVRETGASFEGPYLEDELFLLEYFAPDGARLAVTEEPLVRYRYNPASATRRYLTGLPDILARTVEIKADLAARYGLDFPGWRDSALWAALLIIVGNEYARGNPKTLRERREYVADLCRRPDFAGAMARLHPKGMGRNKQIVAELLLRRQYWLLTLLYKLKNHL